MALLDELKRRNVFRVAGLYVVGSWLVIQVATTVFPLFEALAGLPRIITLVLVIGFVPALVFSWVFELTPEGLKREDDVPRTDSITRDTGRRLDRIIMVVLALALGYFAVDKFVFSPARERTVAAEAREAGRTEAVLGSFGDKSIAVLPFVDLSPSKDQEYFSDGLAEELLDMLSKLPDLRVTSRSSAFSFKGQNLSMHEIAERLNVAHVLEGSVRKAGNRIRVTAQLIDARTDRNLWSETYDRNLDDIFAVQDEISAAVLQQLKVALLGGAKATRVNPQAYDLFLQARPYARLHTAEGYARAVELYQQSAAIDASYAPTWTQLAYCYRRQANNSMRPLKEGYALAHEALDRALNADPGYAPAYSELSRIALDYDGNPAAAARYIERGIALEPNSAEVLGYAGSLAQSLGRFDLGFALSEYALARDPLNPAQHNVLGVGLRMAGRWDEALMRLRRVLELSPGDISAHYRIAEVLLLTGDAAGALAASEQEPHVAWRLTGLALANHSLGRHAESDRHLAELTKLYGDSWPYNIAYVHAWRGETELAFKFLDKAREVQDPSLSDVGFGQFFASLHDDPRWLPYLRSVRKAPEQLAAIKFEVKVPTE